MAVAELTIIKTILLILLAAVAAIIYSLRIVVSMDRKLLRIESHMEVLIQHLVKKLGPRTKKVAKKKPAKKKVRKKSKKRKN